MQLKINHTTRYTYDAPAVYALQKVRLRPLPSPLQTIDAWDVQIEGGKIEVSYIDHYGNHTDLVSADRGVQQLSITAHGQVSVVDNSGVLGPVYGRAPLWHFSQATPLTRPGPGVAALSKVIDLAGNTLDGLHDLSMAIIAKAPYEIGKTNIDTTAEEALTLGAGVCQDHANIFISAARQAGLAARYVSGYLMMNDRVDQDATHAWAEVHVDDLGWVGFDVSNGVSPDARYVRIAVGRDARDAAPVTGMRLGPSSEEMIVTLQVQQ